MRILLADDDEGVRAVVEHVVRDAGHDFLCAVNGQEALGVFEKEKPDLLILDVMMPKLNGFEVVSQLRERGSSVPVIMLTAKGDIVDKSIGFKSGADDYLVKPFIPQELELRIEALLRRGQKDRGGGSPMSELRYGDLEIETKRRRVTVAGNLVELTPKEFHLLHMLAASPGEVFSRERLIEDVWGPEYAGEVTSLTVLVRRLRSKIEEDPSAPKYVKTVWHMGYRFGD